MFTLTHLLNWLSRNEEGQDLIEYALLIVLIVLVVAAVLPGVGDAVSAVFQDITAQLGG